MRWYLRSAERRPDPEPLPSPDRGVIWTLTAVWAVLFVIALIQRDQLIDQGRGWWVWTPIPGIALGLIGVRWLSGKGR
ncbi:MAG: hypothetical protein U0Q19_13075 [Kineosporiaceae bacterium]